MLSVRHSPGIPSVHSFSVILTGKNCWLLFLVPAIATMNVVLVLGIYVGILLSIATIVMLEVKDRAEENHLALSKLALDVFWPALYMFAGLLVIFSYNDVIAALRYDGAAEGRSEARADAILLGGGSVSGIAHAFIGRWPGAVPWMDFIYFGMFAQIGACLAILALTQGRGRAMQFVGTILDGILFGIGLLLSVPCDGSIRLVSRPIFGGPKRPDDLSCSRDPSCSRWRTLRQATPRALLVTTTSSPCPACILLSP